MIPSRFHFVFGLKRQTEPFHLVHYLCLQSCLQVNQPEAIYFYYRHEPYGYYWDLIKEQVICVRIPDVPFISRYQYPNRYTARFRYAHASDFVRLEKLLAQGGLYADMDTLFVNPVPRALYAKPFVLGRENDIYDSVSRSVRPSVCNAFIMSERDSPFGRLWLERMAGAFNGTWSNHSTLLPFELAQEHPDWVHLEPPHTFYKFMWTREGIHSLLEGLDTDNTGVVSFHLWSHLWWSRWRRDFSNFHAGRITQELLRNVDTSYNVVARRFLPPPERRSFVTVVPSGVKRALAPIRSLTREGGMKPYILAKMAVFSLVPDRVFPRASARFDHGRRQSVESKPRVLFLKPHLEPFGGGEGVGAWALETLKDEYDVTLLTWRPPPWEAINRFYGTHLHPSQVRMICMPSLLERVVALDPDPHTIMRLVVLMRVAKALVRTHDAVVSFCNEVDVGVPAIQYIHYPDFGDKYLEAVEAAKATFGPRIKHLLLKRLRPWRLISGFRFYRVRRNITLVNSDWTGSEFRAKYGVETRTLYPPILKDTPEVPWGERENGFVCIGRISPEKRFENTIALLERVRALGHAVHLHIVGPRIACFAGYYSEIHRLAETRGSWISFDENISRHDLARLIASHRYGINGMRAEHFGVAPCELMCGGAIVFVPDDGGQVEIVGKDQRLVYASPDDAAAKIARVLDDEGLQDELRTRLAAQAKSFGLDHFARDLRGLVAELVSQRDLA